MMLPGLDDRSDWQRARDEVDAAARAMYAAWRRHGDTNPPHKERTQAYLEWSRAMTVLCDIESREK